MKASNLDDNGQETRHHETLLFPLSDTFTARNALDYAIEEANGGILHVVVAIAGIEGTPEGDEDREAAARLLRRAEAWIAETDQDGSVTVETAQISLESYLYGPRDYVNAFERYAAMHDVDRIIIDPDYYVNDIGSIVDSFETMLRETDFDTQIAQIYRPAEHQDPATSFSAVRLGTMFFISLGFYLVLGDPLYWFDWITGIAVAGIVAITLSNVTFATAPVYPTSIFRTIRFAAYVPYLMVEIIKANIAISMVILHPSLPIDPKLTEVNVRVGSGLPLLALANSITLTPGTLTVRANDQRLIVHTLLTSARVDLFGGRLERAVRFVFYGREYAAIASPEERGDTVIYESTDSE